MLIKWWERIMYKYTILLEFTSKYGDGQGRHRWRVYSTTGTLLLRSVVLNLNFLIGLRSGVIGSFLKKNLFL